jgi:ribosome-binding protein aMBF1 (putative translation factor)
MDQLIANDEVLARELQEPAFRERWKRTAPARRIALEVSHYRATHLLSQHELANQLKMSRYQIARLEAGEHQPNPSSLACLAAVLGP